MKKLSFLFAIAILVFASSSTAKAQVKKIDYEYDIDRYVSCIDDNLTGTVMCYNKFTKNTLQTRLHGELTDSNGNIYTLNQVSNIIYTDLNAPWVATLDISDESGNTVYILHYTRMRKWDPETEDYVIVWQIKFIDCL